MNPIDRPSTNRPLSVPALRYSDASSSEKAPSLSPLLSSHSSRSFSSPLLFGCRFHALLFSPRSLYKQSERGVRTTRLDPVKALDRTSRAASRKTRAHHPLSFGPARARIRLLLLLLLRIHLVPHNPPRNLLRIRLVLLRRRRRRRHSPRHSRSRGIGMIRRWSTRPLRLKHSARPSFIRDRSRLWRRVRRCLLPWWAYKSQDQESCVRSMERKDSTNGVYGVGMRFFTLNLLGLMAGG